MGIGRDDQQPKTVGSMRMASEVIEDLVAQGSQQLQILNSLVVHRILDGNVLQEIKGK
jgi:hypothetical protein